MNLGGESCGTDALRQSVGNNIQENVFFAEFFEEENGCTWLLKTR